MQPERHHLKENETLESAIYRQMALNRRHSASAKSVDYQPDFERSVNSPKALIEHSKPKNRLKSGINIGIFFYHSKLIEYNEYPCSIYKTFYL